MQNFTITGNVLGALNLGSVQSIDVTLSNIRAFGNDGLAEALQAFTQAVMDSSQLTTETKNEVLEHTAFLAEQAALSQIGKSQR